jgi:hypothetical protein
MDPRESWLIIICCGGRAANRSLGFCGEAAFIPGPHWPVGLALSHRRPLDHELGSEACNPVQPSLSKGRSDLYFRNHVSPYKRAQVGCC